MSLTTLIPGASLARLAVVGAALVVLELPAACLLVQRHGLEARLADAAKRYEADEQSIGSLQAQLAQCSQAAKASSDSVGQLQAQADAAQAAARQALAAAAGAKMDLAALAAKRSQQVAAPDAAKESCDAAIDDLRAGR